MLDRALEYSFREFPTPEAITEAIDRSRFLVVILSLHCNKSDHVLRELDRASHSRLGILPFCVENREATRENFADGLLYFLSLPQWFDASVPPREERLGQFAAHVQQRLLETAYPQEPCVLGPKTKPVPHTNRGKPFRRNLPVALAFVLVLSIVPASLNRYFRPQGTTSTRLDQNLSARAGA